MLLAHFWPLGNRSGYAWLVELAVLPPLNGPEFREPVLPPSGEDGKECHREHSSGHFGFEAMPVSQAVVAEIFYLERQPYGCLINDFFLFPRQ